jgi:hypothetical protein
MMLSWLTEGTYLASEEIDFKKLDKTEGTQSAPQPPPTRCPCAWIGLYHGVTSKCCSLASLEQGRPTSGVDSLRQPRWRGRGTYAGSRPARALVRAPASDDANLQACIVGYNCITACLVTLQKFSVNVQTTLCQRVLGAK